MTARFMVSHDGAERQKLVLQRDEVKVTKEERPLARSRSVAFSVGVNTLHTTVAYIT